MAVCAFVKHSESYFPPAKISDEDGLNQNTPVEMFLGFDNPLVSSLNIKCDVGRDVMTFKFPTLGMILWSVKLSVKQRISSFDLQINVAKI